MRVGSTIPVVFLSAVLAGCSGSDPDDTDVPTGTPTAVPDADPWMATGSAQKGPFLEGATVTVEPREGATGDTSAPVTGAVDATGRYDLGELPWGGPTTVTVEGAWFHEIDAEPAEEPLRLRAVVFAEGALSVNANLLSHLHAGRVDVLVAGGTGFLDAVQTAQTELQALAPISREPWALDYFSGGTDPDDGILLLFSAAFASDDAEQVQLDMLASDFADDGQLNTFGVPFWEALLAEMEDEDLIEDALDGLAEGYPDETPVTPPPGLPDLAWAFDCAPLGPDEVCADGEATLPLTGGTATFTLKPTIRGQYSARVSHGFCAGASATSSLGGGTDTSTGTIIESFLPSVLEDGQEVTYTVTVGCPDVTDVDVDFYRVADGSQSDPMWMPPRGRFVSFYASTPSTHLSSWYALPLSAIEAIPGTVIDVADLRLVSSITPVRIAVYDLDDLNAPVRVETCSVPCVVDHRTGVDGEYALIEVTNAGPLEVLGSALFELD